MRRYWCGTAVPTRYWCGTAVPAPSISAPGARAHLETSVAVTSFGHRGMDANAARGGTCVVLCAARVRPTSRRAQPRDESARAVPHQYRARSWPTTGPQADHRVDDLAATSCLAVAAARAAASPCHVACHPERSRQGKRTDREERGGVTPIGEGVGLIRGA